MKATTIKTTFDAEVEITYLNPHEKGDGSDGWSTYTEILQDSTYQITLGDIADMLTAVSQRTLFEHGASKHFAQRDNGNDEDPNCIPFTLHSWTQNFLQAAWMHVAGMRFEYKPAMKALMEAMVSRPQFYLDPATKDVEWELSRKRMAELPDLYFASMKYDPNSFLHCDLFHPARLLKETTVSQKEAAEEHRIQQTIAERTATWRAAIETLSYNGVTSAESNAEVPMLDLSKLMVGINGELSTVNGLSVQETVGMTEGRAGAQHDVLKSGTALGLEMTGAHQTADQRPPTQTEAAERRHLEKLAAKSVAEGMAATETFALGSFASRDACETLQSDDALELSSNVSRETISSTDSEGADFSISGDDLWATKVIPSMNSLTEERRQSKKQSPQQHFDGNGKTGLAIAKQRYNESTAVISRPVEEKKEVGEKQPHKRTSSTSNTSELKLNKTVNIISDPVSVNRDEETYYVCQTRVPVFIPGKSGASQGDRLGPVLRLDHYAHGNHHQLVQTQQLRTPATLWRHAAEQLQQLHVSSATRSTKEQGASQYLSEAQGVDVVDVVLAVLIVVEVCAACALIGFFLWLLVRGARSKE